MYYRSHARRIIFIDELRGLCILLMVAYHGAYNLVYIFGLNIPIFHAPLLQNFAQPFVAGVFVAISGIVSRYSKSNIKRGMLVLGCGLAITAATYFFMPDMLILFGILHLLGVCMILFGILSYGRDTKIRPDHLPAFSGVVILSLLFALTYGVPRGYLGFRDTAFFFRLPEWLYSEIWLSPLGFLNRGFITVDYFPIIPWVFLFFAGTYLGAQFHAGGAPEFFYRSRSRFLSATGKHTLIIYLLHQPVIYGVMLLLSRILP
jgi:uncharacterized membrane protein